MPFSFGDAAVFVPRFMPCPLCGESLERSVAGGHRCDRERLAKYQLFSMRADIDTFEADLRRYLDTAGGRFEVWLAARQVHEGTGR